MNYFTENASSLHRLRHRMGSVEDDPEKIRLEQIAQMRKEFAATRPKRIPRARRPLTRWRRKLKRWFLDLLYPFGEPRP
jgi:hypothetical protein